MDVFSAKLVCMAVLGIVSITFGVLPIFIHRWCLKSEKNADNEKQKKNNRPNLFLSGITCFGGGVIITTALTHMLPEVNHLLVKNIQQGQFPETGLPMAEIMALCGFFMIYMVEELTHALVDMCHNKTTVPFGHHHSGPHEHDLEENGVQHPLFHQKDPSESSDDIHFNYKNKEEDAEKYFQAALKGFLVVLALSLHEIFEGVALGLFRDQSSVWFLFLAISFHKFVIAFCLGMQFVTSGIKTWLVVLYVSTFSLVTVVGAGIGLALSESASSEETLQSSFVTVLQGLATGTLLYVAFFEVLEKERQSGANGIFQMGFVILGFLAMILFELVTMNEMPKSEIEMSPSLAFTNISCSCI